MMGGSGGPGRGDFGVVDQSDRKKWLGEVVAGGRFGYRSVEPCGRGAMVIGVSRPMVVVSTTPLVTDLHGIRTLIGTYL